jgi:hypothetical protein
VRTLICGKTSFQCWALMNNGTQALMGSLPMPRIAVLHTTHTFLLRLLASFLCERKNVLPRVTFAMSEAAVRFDVALGRNGVLERVLLRRLA